MLAAKKRIRLSVSVKEYLQGIETHYPALPMNAQIAADAFCLPLEHGDPFDRIIIATAKYHALPLLTRDQIITGGGMVDVIW